MKKTIILSSIISLLFASSLLAVDNKTYAIVNGDKITLQTIAIALKDPEVKFDTLPKDTQKNILGKIIEQKLLSQNAMKTDIVNKPAYKDTLKSLTQDLALQVWIQEESKKIDMPDGKLKKYYNDNKSTFNLPEQFHARHILVKTKDEAIAVIKTLTKSSDKKAKFISLAKTKSTGPSGANGGDLGFFKPEQMVPEFSGATAKLKIGTFTKTPVKTQFGYHIIYLEDKKNATTVSFEKAKLQIKQKLGQDQLIKNIQKLANSLKKKAKITYK